MPARLRVATSGTAAMAGDYGNGTAAAGQVLTSVGADAPPTWAAPGGAGAGDVAIVEDCSLLLPNGEATGGIATSPFSPVVYAIVSMACSNGQKVLLQFTPVYWLALSEENIGDFIQLQCQYSLNGADWFDFGLISNELGNDTVNAVVLCTLSRIYTHAGANAVVQFRVNVDRVSGGVAGDISARNGSLIASRFG